MSRAWHITRTHNPSFREEKAWSDLSVVPRRHVLLCGPLHPRCMVTFVKLRRLRCLLVAVFGLGTCRNMRHRLHFIGGNCELP